MADDLLGWVLAGRMTASCMARASVGVAGPMPRPGARAVVLDGHGRPGAVIETVSLREGPIESVTADFIRAEGYEGMTREGWLDEHRAVFTAKGIWAPGMPVIFERFRLVTALPR